MTSLSAIRRSPSTGLLEVLDQRLLPLVECWLGVEGSSECCATRIKEMAVRGAPAIAILAALGLAEELKEGLKAGRWVCADADAGAGAEVHEAEAVRSVKTAARRGLDVLSTSRPTAVNLFHAVATLRAVLERDFPTVAAVVHAIVEAAEAIEAAERAACDAMGDAGATAVLEAVSSSRRVRVLTHCNTGSLATAGIGTALGVVRRLWSQDKLAHVVATETRPYWQGARLTAFELVHEERHQRMLRGEEPLPLSQMSTLITDSAVAAMLSRGEIDAVLVGADRITANGDVANKIGTCQIAIVAKHFGVPFFVVAPTTTVDLSLHSGKDIHIEQRPPEEITHVAGQRIAAPGISVWNPSFDVTPAALITGIVTERGVARPAIAANGSYEFDMVGFLASPGVSGATAVAPVAASPEGYRVFDAQSLAAFLLQEDSLRARLGGVARADELSIEEVGDGNLNLVFICKSRVGDAAIVVKQALPYVRCVGESWPLPTDRALFEHEALLAQARVAPASVPSVLFFDRRLALIAMSFVAPPHVILRKALCEGRRISTFAAQMGAFCAETLFSSSGLVLDGGQFRAAVGKWSGNAAQCALTEQVVFTEPFDPSAANNRWTNPQLSGIVRELQGDALLRSAVADLKRAFLQHAEALIHGDLHSGSVMVCEGSTVVIDPEFAFMGPMGFDLGALVANLLIAFVAHAGRDPSFAAWILEQVRLFYGSFERCFLELWTAESTAHGELFRHGVFGSGGGAEAAGEDGLDGLAAVKRMFLARVRADTWGFAGVEMIRRIIGIAHVADFESIVDPDVRAACERRALLLARRLVLERDAIGTIDDVVAMAR
jgi:5-methylthioribose kinase